MVRVHPPTYFLAMGFLMGLVACTETQVLVHFDGDEELIAEAVELRVRVAASDETPGQIRTLSFGSAVFRGFPLVQPVSPFEGRAGRSFDVTGELVRSDGTVIARQRAVGSYLDGSRSHVALHFSAACRETSCAAEENCVRGRCESVCVVPSARADVPPTPIACGVTGDGGVDAAPGDAATDGASDAAPCSRGCPVLAWCEGGECVPEPVRDLSVGHRASCVVLESGRVVCWGRNACGELGLSPPSEPTSRAVTSPHDLGIRADAVDCGFHHCCALSGTEVRCWGANGAGQLARPDGNFRAPVGTCGTVDTPLTDYSSTPVVVPVCEATQLTVAGDYACALCMDGTVQCWGANEAGQGGRQTPTHLRTPMTVPEVADAMQIEGGPFHACARHGDGRVSCWGFGARGQLGREMVARGAPAFVETIDDATDLWLGLQHTCALQGDGRVWCWGAGETTQAGAEGEVLGEPLTRVDIARPRQVEGLSGISQLARGNGAHLCAVREGALRCWGAQGIRTRTTETVDAPGHGELGRGGTWDQSQDALSAAPVDGEFVVSASARSAVGCGRNHTCAVASDQRVYCWGDDTYGQTSLGAIRRVPTLVRGYAW